MGNCVTIGPNQAIVKSGSGGTKVRVGTTTFVWGICQQHTILPLEILTLNLKCQHAETALGVPVDVVGVAQVKVDAYIVDPNADKSKMPDVNYSAIKLAAQHFLGDSEETILKSLTETMNGLQRQIIGTLTVEELFSQREKLIDAVRDHMIDDLNKLGYKLVSYVVQSITDSSSYMESLGKTQIAMVRREAEEGRAYHMHEANKFKVDAESRASSEVSKHNQRSNAKKNICSEAEAASDRSYKLAQAKFTKEVGTAEAQARNAYNFTMEQQKQKIVYEQATEKKIMETEKSAVALLQIERTKREKTGLSEAELMEQSNKAQSTRIVSQATAAKIRMLGTADADIVLWHGEAEARVLHMKALAYDEFGEAAVLQLVISKIPDITRAVTEPMCCTEKIVIVSVDGGAGASALTKDIVEILKSVPNAVENMTNYDVRSNIQNLTMVNQNGTSV